MGVFTVLREFAGGTSIHGFCYLVQNKSSTLTKIIWTLSLMVAIGYASYEMRKSVIGKKPVLHLAVWLVFYNNCNKVKVTKGQVCYVEAF